MTEAATVYLVGAGPGEVGLLTARGLDLLRHADVVIYDNLANPSLLDEAPANAELVSVGKRGFSNHVSQDEINDLLVSKAQEAAQHGGNVIVRLKGGDPFVFGRGGEEALACVHAGVPFEVIPGITSGIAAPAYAGIPVTHRGFSSSVTFVTGHEDPSKPGSAINWPALAQLAKSDSTICFFMGMHDLGRICAQLQEHGLPAGHPMAIVQWGTTSRQRTLSTTLDRAVEDVLRADFRAPAIIVVGEVALLRDELSWFENRPLFGKTIVVTRPKCQARAFSEKLRALGADVIEFPTVEIADPDDPAMLVQALSHVDDYDWIVFTSVNGVNAFFRRLDGDARVLSKSTIAAIGPETAKRLSKHGIKADVVPDEYRGESLFAAMQGHVAASGGSLSGAHVLLTRAQEARETLPTMLREAGAIADVVPAYKTVMPEDSDIGQLADLLETGDVHGIAFTSPSTARNMVAMLGSRATLLEKTILYSIGPVTGSAIRNLGFDHVIHADVYTTSGLADAIARSVS